MPNAHKRQSAKLRLELQFLYGKVTVVTDDGRTTVCMRSNKTSCVQLMRRKELPKVFV
jgi:hypothetical protein